MIKLITGWFETKEQLYEHDSKRASRPLIAFVIGMLSMRKLTTVKDAGEIPSDKVLSELFDQVFMPIKMATSVEGLRSRVAQPVASVLRAVRQRKQRENRVKTNVPVDKQN